MKNSTFREMRLTKGNLRVVWEYVGEGWGGDYNPNDPKDTPFLRFSCDEKINGVWEGIEDSSYCTQMSANTSRSTLKRGLKYIMSGLKEAVDAGRSVRKVMERNSWLSPKDFECLLSDTGE